MPPRRGRPPKKKRNITGLRNQSNADPTDANDPACSSDQQDQLQNPNDDDQHVLDLKSMADSEKEDDEYSDFDSDGEWPGIGERSFAERMVALMEKDDPNDLDWLPSDLRRARERQKGTFNIHLPCCIIFNLIYYVI